MTSGISAPIKYRSERQPGQRLGEAGDERSGGGTDPEGGHGQRGPGPAGCAQRGGGQQGRGASHRQVRAAKDAVSDPLIPPRGRGLAMSMASDRYTRAHTDNSERREDATGIHSRETSRSLIMVGPAPILVIAAAGIVAAAISPACVPAVRAVIRVTVIRVTDSPLPAARKLLVFDRLLPLTGMEHADEGGLAGVVLAVLRWNWGRAYEIEHDAGVWRARRRDGRGSEITASSPEVLRDGMFRDYDADPVR